MPAMKLLDEVQDVFLTLCNRHGITIQMNSTQDKPEVELSPEQNGVMTHIEEGRNVLVTGSAGTGKSTLLKALSRKFKDLPIVASTGIAAVNVGGVTVHSWTGIGISEDPADAIFRNLSDRNSPALRRVKKASILALDEVSMIHGDTFEQIDHLFRLIREDSRPFGGMQMVLFGDFLQLPPVAKGKGQRFAFQSDSWTEANIKTHMLTKVFRQEDSEFSSALNDIRVGNLSKKVTGLLKSRLKAKDPSPEITPVTVFTHNADVDKMNEAELKKIPGKPKEWFSRDVGQSPYLTNLQKNCLAPETLRLKEGAQVMLLWNLAPEEGLANGSIGTVIGFGKHTGLPLVKFACGREEEIDKKTWDVRLGNEVVASRTQIPLRLAWAITAHKSQGMTLDKIQVHLHRVFEYGQSYVALSRARSLQGLFIESAKDGCIKAHPDAVAFYQNAAQ